jgi:hypothetical protein
MKIYLSSTLSDLEKERAAVKEVLTGEAIVKDSYKAHEADLRESCIQDIAGSDLYIGILGLRYGFIPPGETKSITHLEYDAAALAGVPRLVFIKHEEAITLPNADARTKEHPPELIDDFRKQVSSGRPGEPRPAVFSTLEELKLGVQKAVSDFRARRAGTPSLMRGRAVHPWEIKYELSIAYVPGTDDGLREAVERGAGGDQRVQLFPLSPVDPDYLSKLDDQARRARTVLLLASPRSVPRLAEGTEIITHAIDTVRHRNAARLSVLSAGVNPVDLRSALGANIGDLFETKESDWDAASAPATFERLQRWRRERQPTVSDRPAVGIPYLTIALTLKEALDLRDRAAETFAGFGDAGEVRRKGFTRLAEGLKELQWPDAFYGSRREDWRPFGSNAPNIETFVEGAARKVNTAADGSRERRVLLDSTLLPHRYLFDEYLTDRGGSRDNVQRVCDRGCLVLVDEFALLHPVLRRAADKMLGSNNAAVVSLSACDPALSPLPDLLGDLSHLRVGNLMSRFQQIEDVRCELALNSMERLQRWLRLVLPELMTTLAEQQSNPELVSKVDALFA